MIASCYTMDLYCDGSPCKDPRYGGGERQITGETWGECATYARKNGWKITRDRKAFCPYCTGKRKPVSDGDGK